MTEEYIKLIKSLPIWKEDIDIKKIEGGLTNFNFLITEQSRKVVVRIGKDILEHQIIRSNELISSKAAYDVGIGPEILYSCPGILVLKFIDSKVLSSKDVISNIDRIINLIKKVHLEIPKKLYGPASIFWVFHVIKNYVKFLRDNKSVYIYMLDRLLSECDKLEFLSSPHNIVFAHNDLLAANFLDDGNKLWLIDWEYSGFNTPLFDLGGLASNNNFSFDQEIYLLESYFEKKVTSNLLCQYKAMKCASLLRETMWSMVSEISSKIDFDYSDYTKKNLLKYVKSYKEIDN